MVTSGGRLGLTLSGYPDPRRAMLSLTKVTLMKLNVIRTPPHTACTDSHRVSAHYIALIPWTTSVAQD